MNKFLVSCTIALTILVSACQKESLQDGSLQSQSEGNLSYLSRYLIIQRLDKIVFLYD